MSASNTNVYAPSAATLKLVDAPEPTGGPIDCWREGNVLVLKRNCALPDRCVKCNAPAHEPTKARWVYWHHWAVFLLVPLNMILYLVVALIVRKKAKVSAGLCAQHKRRRRIGIAVAWGGVLAAILLPIIGATAAPLDFKGPVLVSMGILLLVVMLVIGVRMSRIFFPKKIDRDYLWLKGCGTAFLDSLPEQGG